MTVNTVTIDRKGNKDKNKSGTYSLACRHISCKHPSWSGAKLLSQLVPTSAKSGNN